MGRCGIAAADVKFCLMWEVKSRHLEMDLISKLVNLGPGWSAPQFYNKSCSK